MYHELSLIVLGVLHQGADGSSSHVMPTLVCARAGIYGCGLQESALLNIKPDIAYRGEVGSSILASAEAEKKESEAGTVSARKVKTHISTFFDPYLNQKHYGGQDREVWGK